MSESLSRAGLVRKDAPELRDLTERIRALREHDKELKELKKQLNREKDRRMRERYKLKFKVKSER
jgi:nicotinic acid phosphoribosyltransferase